MNCPKCKTEMKVTNTYQAGDAGNTQRLECPNCQMECTAFVATFLINERPGWGEGAAASAKRIAKHAKKVLEKAQKGIADVARD